MGAGASSQRHGEPGSGAVSLSREEIDACRTTASLEKLLLARCPDVSALRSSDGIHVLSHLAMLAFTARSCVSDEPAPAGTHTAWDFRSAAPAKHVAHALAPGLLTHGVIRGTRPRGVCNLLWALGVLHSAHLLPSSGAGAVTPEVLRTCEAVLSLTTLPSLSPNDCANALWGFAVLGHQPHTRWLSGWTSAWVAGLQSASQPAVHLGDTQDDVAPAPSGRVHPRAVSRALVACALLGDVAHVVGFDAFHASMDALCSWQESDGAGVVPPDVLASTLWALTALKVVPKPRVHGSLCALCASSFSSCSRGELCRLLWGLASCGVHPGTAWLESMETHLADARHSLRTAAAPWRPRHGSAEARPQQHQQAADSAVAAAAAGDTAWEEATVLWAYATLGVAPHPAAVDARCERCVSAAELAVGGHSGTSNGAASITGVCDSLQHLLWALGRLRHRPQRGALLVRLADVLAPRMLVLGASGIGGVVLAYAQIGASPGADVLAKSADWWRDTLRRGNGISHSGGSLALCHTLYGWATLGYHPGEHVLDAAAKALLTSHPSGGAPHSTNTNSINGGHNDDGPLAHLPPGGLCCALFAFGTWAHVPAAPGFLGAASQAVALHASGCTLRELSQCVWALAALAHHPGRPWLDSIAPAVVGAVSGASQEVGLASATLCGDVAHLLWGLLVLREHSRGTSSSAGLKGARMSHAAANSDASSATLAAWLSLASLADDGVANDPFSLTVLLTAELLLQSEAPSLARAFAARSSALTPHRAQRRGDWRAAAVAAWKASAVHAVEAVLKHPAYADICSTLAMLRVPYTPAKVSADHMLCLDVVIRPEELLTQDQLVTCLSLDGQPAFLRGGAAAKAGVMAPTGGTLLRDRVYEALRVRTMSLPLPLWATASKTKGERQRDDARGAVLARVLGKLYA